MNYSIKSLVASYLLYKIR